MKKKFIYLYLFSSLLLITGCASTSIRGKSYLCGVIVGENNKPIPDFVVTCSGKGKIKNIATTNESGIFIMNNILPGKYNISGKKNGYGLIHETINLKSKEKVLCFKVNSIESVINSVKKQMISGNYEIAKQMLNDIYFEKNTPEEITVLFYQTYLEKMLGNEKEAQHNLKKLKQLAGTEYFEQYVILEEMFNDFEA